MKQIAILGPTASGKSALAVEIAKEVDANILSLDSLAIYRETDIVSAKPTREEMESIRHFGIDILNIDDYFSAATFFDLYHEAKHSSEKAGKHLIIVGGTSFYLKSMIEGLSAKVTLSKEHRQTLKTVLSDLPEAYAYLRQKDKLYAQNIASADRYRIQKWYEIYLETGLDATTFFRQNRREPIIEDIAIFDIAIERNELRKRIERRTEKMLENGLVEEVFQLEKKYTRKPNPMKAIGIKETLAYLDGKYTFAQLHELISIHTAQLAKRQETFNSSQFPRKIKLLKDDLRKEISKFFN